MTKFKIPQSEYREMYNKALKNLERRIKNQEKQGYFINRELLPKTPRHFTEEHISRIENIGYKQIREISTHVDLETGTILSSNTIGYDEFYVRAYKQFKSAFIGHNLEGSNYILNWFHQQETQHSDTELGILVVTAQQEHQIEITKEIYYYESEAREFTEKLAMWLTNIGAMTQNEYGEYVLATNEETWEEPQ